MRCSIVTGSLPQVSPALRQPQVLRGLLRVEGGARQVRRLLREVQGPML
jgi:hypothetical protein